MILDNSKALSHHNLDATVQFFRFSFFLFPLNVGSVNLCLLYPFELALEILANYLTTPVVTNTFRSSHPTLWITYQRYK